MTHQEGTDMIHLHFIAACTLPVLLGGCPAPAGEGARKLEDRLVVYPGYSTMMTLHNGRFKEVWDQEWLFPPWERHESYNYGNVTYRILSGAEKARMDAMGKVEVKRGRLYFDGRKIRTNAWWVTRVYAAYHWNGGVVLAANTSKGATTLYSFFGYTYLNEIGFLDLKSDRCEFTPAMLLATGMVVPDFMEPVRIETDHEGIALDVALPDKVFLGEEIDLAFSLTNRSGVAIPVPDPLAGGFKMKWAQLYRDQSSGEDVPRGGLCVDFGDLADPRAPSSPLAPNERRASTVPLNVRKAFYLNDAGAVLDTPTRLGSYTVFFQWYGFLDPSDKRKMSRATCERRMELAEPTIDKSNGALRLDVTIPKSVQIHGDIEVTVGLTNVSDRTVQVPDDPSDGLGVVWMRDDPVLRSHQKKYPVLLDPRRNPRSPLRPGERREGKATFSGFHWSGPYCLEFYWDIMLNPDDRGLVSRFSLGKPIWVNVR